MIEIPVLPALEKALHISTTAISIPENGVHKPRSRSIPAPPAIICGEIETNCEASLMWSNP
jgi:hypothetical protein